MKPRFFKGPHSIEGLHFNEGNVKVQIDLMESETGGRYATVIDGAEAELTFSKTGDTMIIIDHTDVPDSLRGKGVGVALVERAVADARKDSKKILPLCPFAAAQFRKHPDWSDLIAR